MREREIERAREREREREQESRVGTEVALDRDPDHYQRRVLEQGTR